MTSPATPASARVHEELITALELDLVGPTPAVLAQLAAAGETSQAEQFLAEQPPVLPTPMHC